MTNGTPYPVLYETCVLTKMQRCRQNASRLGNMMEVFCVQNCISLTACVSTSITRLDRNKLQAVMSLAISSMI